MIDFKNKFDGINLVAAIMHLREAAVLVSPIDDTIGKAIYQIADLLVENANDQTIQTDLDEFKQISDEITK
jgi:flavoprotein